jgi:YjbE family integral membrane protein
MSLNWDYVLSIVNIILIDLALSGDNAIVIAMAAATLPKSRRKWAIAVGGAGAIALRIGLTSLAAWLLTIPLLSAAGGLVLVWVVYRLLRTSGSESEKAEKQAENFKQAVIIILAADFMMSLDNVLAIAGAAHSDEALLIIGLLVSMPLLMVAGGAISLIIDRFKWLKLLGAFAISFSAVRMIFDDRFIAARFPQPEFIVILTAVALGIAIPALFWWLDHRRASRKNRIDSSPD